MCSRSVHAKGRWSFRTRRPILRHRLMIRSSPSWMPSLAGKRSRTRSRLGRKAPVHVDSVLEHNEDPTYLADLLLYRLSNEARERFDASPLSAREVARLLGTSCAQMYRVLDPTNYSKSVRQLFALLNVLGCDVEVEVRDRPSRRAAG